MKIPNINGGSKGEARGARVPLIFRPGARFSKVPVTFRARNQMFKSKYKEEERGSWLANYSILFH